MFLITWLLKLWYGEETWNRVNNPPPTIKQKATKRRRKR